MAKQKKTQAKQSPEKSTAKIGKRTFTKRLMVPGYGFVDVGQELTPEIQKAWVAWTKSPVEDFTKE